MSKVVLITGASSGFDRLMAEALAEAGHKVYGSMRQMKSRNAAVVKQIAAFSHEHRVELRALELDVQSQGSVDAAVAQVLAEAGYRRSGPQCRPHGVWPGRSFYAGAIC